MKLERWDTKEVIFKLDCSFWEELLTGALKAKVSFYRADFRGADFSGADFSGANLRGAYSVLANGSTTSLYRANFRGADFRGADFRGAYFSGANFSSADFSGADLRGADFSRAYFSSAYFSSADFSGADFSGADLSGADLRGVNLTNVKLFSVSLFDVTFSDTKGIEYFKEYHIYKYKSFILVQTDKEPSIRMGCHQRTVTEWEADFWNNNREFPNDGSDESNKRFECFQTIIRDYEKFKKQQGKQDDKNKRDY